MSGCEDQTTECPLCMEPLEMDDINFFPCTCGYQICRFCWHRIRTDENGLCPACRKQYPEDPADFKPLTQEELLRIKNEKRQKDMQKKAKISENRKHLSNVRVVQKNLVFVVGLSHRLADPEVLKRHEYFGKFGKTHKVVINHSTTYAGSQGPSASAYVTYYRVEDALRAIQAVNNIHVDGRTLKASLGTTKYCSHFLKGQQCPKSDCMYLHELGDDAASFTKEEMQQGKHQEYEKKLHEQLFNSLGKQAPSSLINSSSSTNSNSTTNNSVQESEGTTRDSWPALRSGSGSNNSSSSNSSSNRGNKQQSKLENGHSQTRNGSRTRTVSGEDNTRNKSLDEFPSNHINSFNSYSTRNSQTPESRSTDSPQQNLGFIGSSNSSVNVGSSSNVNSGSAPSSFCSNSGPSLSQTSSGIESPSQSLANLDSSSSTSSSLSTSSADIAPYFESRNGFSENANSLQPVVNSLSEWTNAPIENGTEPSPAVETQKQENTDWQAAFGFGSSQNRDDDLGFDPWDESAKGLAALIEKESSGGHAILPPTFMNGGLNHEFHFGDSANTQTNQHPRHQMPNLIHLNGSLNQQQPISRRLGAPPGFFPNSPSNSNSYKVSRPSFNYEDYHLQASLMNHNPFGLNPLKSHMMKDIHESHGNNRHLYGTKESQDNFRALLPNINITFGGANVPLNQQSTLSKGWNCNHDNSWPIHDPAVVSAGAVSDGRPESPPHWMNSLHQLTEIDYPLSCNNHPFPVNQFQNRHAQWSNQSQTPPGFSNPMKLAFRSNETQKMVDNF